MPTEQLTSGRRAVVTGGLALSMFLAALDQTIVGNAMPRIVAELRGLEVYAWVLTAYLVGATTVIPIAGKLGDLFGRKLVLLAGMIGFVLASALCGQARDMSQLIAFRALQGVFAGVLIATVFASIADLFTPEQRPRIQGMFGGIWGIASVIGPTVGGFLVDGAGWRWIFYVNVPIGLLAIAFVALTMPAAAPRATWRDIDGLGAVTLVAGLVPLLVGVSITSTYAWTSPQVLLLLAFAAVMLVAFFAVERRAREPIVPFDLFRNRTFAVAVATGFLVAVGMFGTIVFVPLVYQGVLGIAATNSGLLLTPMMLGIIAGSIGAGQLMLRIRAYRFVGTAGIATLLVGLLLLSRVRVGTPELEVVGALVLVGLGVGATFPLYLNSVQAAVDRRLTGVVTSQVQFFRNVGATIGTAVLGSILSARLPDRIATSVGALDLPPQARAAFARGDSAQGLFDPAQLAAAQAALPAGAQPLFDEVLLAVRTALATTLAELFVYSAAIVVAALVVSVFLEDVPIRGRARERLASAPAIGD